MRISSNRLSGIDGCNRYGGVLEEETPVAGADGVFSLPPLGITEKYCFIIGHPDPDFIVDQGDAFISALTRGERYRVAGDRLEILDGEGVTMLVVRPRGAALRTTRQPSRYLLAAHYGRRRGQHRTCDHPDLQWAAGLRVDCMRRLSRSYKLSYELSEVSLRFPSRSMLGFAESCFRIGPQAGR